MVIRPAQLDIEWRSTRYVILICIVDTIALAFAMEHLYPLTAAGISLVVSESAYQQIELLEADSLRAYSLECCLMIKDQAFPLSLASSVRSLGSRAIHSINQLIDALKSTRMNPLELVDSSFSTLQGVTRGFKSICSLEDFSCKTC